MWTDTPTGSMATSDSVSLHGRSWLEDVVQDVFVAALRGLDRFEGQSSLQSWLIGIARHKVEDYYRDRLRISASLSDADDETLTPHTCRVHGSKSRSTESGRRTRLSGFWSKLPEPYALVLLWRYWEKA